MRPLLVCLLASTVVMPGTTTSEVSAPQARDAGTPPTIGTAAISGVVVDDAQPARPVRRAIVTLTGAGLHPNRGAITDDEGRFSLRDLPAGRFTLTAERGAFVTSVYGAKRPGRAGTAITVADGQRVADLRVRIWRGAVLSGVLSDDSGAPLANTAVAAIPSREITPVALTLSNRNQAMTNDLGEYRIFGLEPGTYVVRAGSAQLGSTEIVASDAEIDAKLAALAVRSRQPGALQTPPDRPQASEIKVSTAPIYFPGTPAVADATAIALQAGEERGGLDFAVGRIRIATIRGTVVGSGGTPLAGAFVRLAAGTGPVAGAAPTPVTTTARADGTFELGPLSPGDYRLLARGAVAPAGASASVVSGPFGWTVVPISVTGDDVDLASLTVQPGMTFSGRVVFDRSPTTPPPDPTGLRVQMETESLAMAPTQSRGGGSGPPGMRFLQPAAVRTDGTFEVTDLVPDDYQLTVSGNAVNGSPWWLRAAMRNGVDLLDGRLRLAPGENVRDVTLVLSDRHSELSGTLTTAGGAAVSDVFVLAFPADAALRVPHSRRLQAVRPDSSGRFVLKNLPAGEYFLCALTDVDGDEWNDPAFLAPLVSASARITVTDGGKTVQNLQVRGS